MTYVFPQISADSMDAYVSSLFSATMPIILSSLYASCQLSISAGRVFDDECRSVGIFAEGFHDVANQVIWILFHLVRYVIVQFLRKRCLSVVH